MTENEAIKEIKRWTEILLRAGSQCTMETAEAQDMAIKALEEVQQYRALGTPEECRAAREKQMPKRPIMKPWLEGESLCCPTCGEILTDRIPANNKDFYFYCMNCGQKFDWEDEG